MVFFNFSHGPFRENPSTPIERLEHLKISKIAKFESDTSYYNERKYSSAKLRKFTKLFGGEQVCAQHHTNVCKIW